MFEILFQKIDEKISLSPEEQESIKPFFTPKKLRKKQYFLQAGEVCKYVVFIEKGALRSYTIDDKGHEHIVQFALEGWWISDNYSFFTSEPSSYMIDALEDSEILLLSLPDYESMVLKVPKMERYLRILMQNSLIALQSRILSSLSYSTEEKYLKLLSTYPDIIHRFPQHLIASYLGIAPETLSRIRKKITFKK
ncbi:MAG TPA: Crp/Fnr family transcriptional regulator [Daejeonella sp.]|nr:Crp/Fnr family transcriptional regulator [Daejeonella sp.]